MNAKRIMKYKRARSKGEVNGAYKADPEKAAEIIASLEAKGLLIEEYNAAEIGAAPDRIGFPGSPTKVKQVSSVVLTASEAKSVAPDADSIKQLIHELITDHTLG
jgi:electron transfer flavoprotein beta subunit